MPATAKLYETDPYVQTFTATVLVCTPAGEQFAVQLDRTAFYPEGGGQPCDTGALGTALVTDVQEHGGVITHTVSAALPVGQTVEGRIDWARRRDHMEQHTGEHILSGTLHRLFGAENVGFHIGSPAVRMDMSVPLTAGQLAEAEARANAVIRADAPVRCWYPAPEDLAKLTYRSKKEIEGQVRIVTIPGADVCACCGTHTRTTGQVGQIKILASENYKGGVRLSIVCGARALEAAQAMRARQADIGALLSAKADQTAVAVHRVYDEYTALKFNHFGLCSQLFQAATKSNHFKELHTYYFHNCIYGDVYNGPRLWQDDQTPTEWLLQNFDASYKVILVGDAAMNPYELREKQYDWRNQRYGPSGLEWLELFKKHFPYLIWLNPEPLPAFQDFWTLTHLQLAKMFPMFDLSAEGLEAGMKRLMVKR